MFQNLLPGDMFQKLLQLGWTESHWGDVREAKPESHGPSIVKWQRTGGFHHGNTTWKMDENGFIKCHRVNRRINDGENGIEIPVIRREPRSYLGTDGYTYTQQKKYRTSRDITKKRLLRMGYSPRLVSFVSYKKCCLQGTWDWPWWLRCRTAYDTNQNRGWLLATLGFMQWICNQQKLVIFHGGS